MKSKMPWRDGSLPVANVDHATGKARASTFPAFDTCPVRGAATGAGVAALLIFRSVRVETVGRG
jgi:hypothetical protein